MSYERLRSATFLDVLGTLPVFTVQVLPRSFLGGILVYIVGAANVILLRVVLVLGIIRILGSGMLGVFVSFVSHQ
jgi:hypothetical protein